MPNFEQKRTPPPDITNQYPNDQSYRTQPLYNSFESTLGRNDNPSDLNFHPLDTTMLEWDLGDPEDLDTMAEWNPQNMSESPQDDSLLFDSFLQSEGELPLFLDDSLLPPEVSTSDEPPLSMDGSLGGSERPLDAPTSIASPPSQNERKLTARYEAEKALYAKRGKTHHEVQQDQYAKRKTTKLAEEKKRYERRGTTKQEEERKRYERRGTTPYKVAKEKFLLNQAYFTERRGITIDSNRIDEKTGKVINLHSPGKFFKKAAELLGTPLDQEFMKPKIQVWDKYRKEKGTTDGYESDGANAPS